MSPERELLRAVRSGDADQVSELLDRTPALLTTADSDGSTLLHCAAWKGHVAVVRLLVDRGADVNRQSRNTHWGGTPLHAAAHANHRAVAELLLEHGADPGARSCNGRTPLEETAVHNASAVARLLRAAGAS